jgi:hypothetical protein
MIEFKNIETQKEIEKLLKPTIERNNVQHLAYYKSVNGRIVDKIIKYEGY